MNKIKYKVYSYLSDSLLPQWTILFLDMAICAFSLMFAYFVISDFSFVFVDTFMLLTIFVTLAVCLIYFRLLHTYLGVLRYSSIVDLMRILLSLGLSVVTLFGINLVTNVFWHTTMVSSTALLLFFFVAISLMILLRLSAKVIFEKYFISGKRSQHVMIYGAKVDGVAIASGLSAILHGKYTFCGFITDEFNLAGNVIMGEKVYPNDDDIVNILALKKVSTVIISPSSLGNLSNTKILDAFIDLGVNVLTIPTVKSQGKQVQFDKIRQIQIEDLLGRSEIDVNISEIEKHHKGRRVLITGAAGSIGSELTMQIAKYTPSLLILVDQAETPLHNLKLILEDKFPKVPVVIYLGSVQNEKRMEFIFSDHRPEYIYHAAAYKHVPMAEDNPTEAIDTNVCGTSVVANLAVKYGAKKFIEISTDKAVNPTNVMGATKRAAEIYVQALNKKLNAAGNSHTQFITTRFGNVLGSNGSVVPLFREQIAKGGPITVTHPDIVRFFMTISEACRLVLEACQMGVGGEIFVFDMGKPMRIVSLAERMIRLSGFKPYEDIQIKYTGLRQGEKLYEEVLNDRERVIPTDNKKIFIAHVREYDFDDVSNKIAKIVQTATTEDSMQSVFLLKELIPEYVSNNSVYENIDKKLHRGRYNEK